MDKASRNRRQKRRGRMRELRDRTREGTDKIKDHFMGLRKLKLQFKLK